MISQDTSQIFQWFWSTAYFLYIGVNEKIIFAAQTGTCDKYVDFFEKGHQNIESPEVPLSELNDL